MADFKMEIECKKWIDANYPTKESALMKCAEATLEMCAAFPELVRVRGHVMVGCDLRPHWWCVDRCGQIIDPTEHQYKYPIVFYQIHEEGDEEPIGKCFCCGELLYLSRGDESYRCRDCIGEIEQDKTWKNKK